MIELRWQNLSLLLRNPDLGNAADYLLGVQRRFDMLGKQHTWVPPQNNSVVHSLTFSALAAEKWLEAREFFIATAGKQIIYTDYNGDVWVGRVTSQPFTNTNDGECQNTFTVQFEGVKNA